MRGRFRLAVDRSFTLPGTGTVVTGTVLSGAVSVGDQVVVSPSGLKARVRSIHAQDRPTERGKAGDRCALNLAGDGISKDAIARGEMVSIRRCTRRPIASMRVSSVLASESKPVTQWMPVRLHHAAAEVGARIVLLGDTPIPPGGEAPIQLVLDTADRRCGRRPLRTARHDGAAHHRRRQIPRSARARAQAPHARASGATRSAYLRRTDAALAALLEIPPFTLDLKNFCRDRALAFKEADVLAERLGLVRMSAGETVLAVSAARWKSFRQMLLSRL